MKMFSFYSFEPQNWIIINVFFKKIKKKKIQDQVRTIFELQQKAHTKKNPTDLIQLQKMHQYAQWK